MAPGRGETNGDEGTAMAELPKRVRQVLEAGQQAGVTVRVSEFAQDGARTAADAARAIGCEVDQIVKSLVFVVAGRPVLVLASGGQRVDPDKLAALGGGAVRKADADEVRAATGYAIGGTPPFGHAQALPAFMDRRLSRFPTVWAAAGTPQHVFPLTPDELARATGARLADVTVQPEAR
jgi:prolyl-tRNA editing enzyme YbaK/EbsC (Cys-tRNA(Pro) deacylase)